MEFKFYFPEGIIYVAMAMYFSAFVLFVANRKKTGRLLFALGFACALIVFAWRWLEVSRLPMRGMFEVFLVTGALVYPVHLACRSLPGVDSEKLDAALGFMLFFPAGFVFTAEAGKLPPALRHWVFGPHVSFYLLGYVFMFKAGFAAALQFFSPTGGRAAAAREETTCRLARAGFPLLTAGLVLGSYWGKKAWGDYWNWDPKEMWGLAIALSYVVYFYFRSATGNRFHRANSALAMFACAVILCTLLLTNLSRLFPGLHSYAH